MMATERARQIRNLTLIVDRKCKKCRNPNLPPRYGIGNGVSVQPCPLCGTQHYQYPPDMKQRTGSAELCDEEGCEEYRDTVTGHYCRTHRIMRQHRFEIGHIAFNSPEARKRFQAS